jgi:ribosomal protein S18 acetylase RimI-like enzyme
MEFIPVAIEDTLNLCIQFRRDAHKVSFGSYEGFSVSDTTSWFQRLLSFTDFGFYHVTQDSEIIGQIEYRYALVDEQGEKYGYINLLYLLPDFRGNGLGLKLQEYILAQLKTEHCKYAQLRYIPTNIQAIAFYRKHGWEDVGNLGEHGQLAQKRLV